MKTVTVTKRARSAHRLLERAKKENLIVRSSEGREFVLAEVNDFDREIELMRENRKLMRFLDKRGRKPAAFSLEEERARYGFK